jgi:hypothetical protein
MSEEPIICRYVFTATEHRRAMLSYWRSTPLLWVLFGIVIISLCFAVFSPTSPSQAHVPPPSPLTSFLNILPVFLFLGLILYLGFGSKLRSFRKKPACDKEFLYIFRDDTLYLENTLAQSEAKWEIFSKVVENKNGFILFYVGSNNFHWFPKSGFVPSENTSRCRELFRRKIRNSKRLFPA